MPLFAVICRDQAGKLQTRLDTRDAHLAFLKAQPGLRMAGPLIEEGEMRGSLLVVEAETLTQVKDWAAGDPYKAADLFASVEVIEWKKVIG
ncbi:YciI family protein [Paracoccus sp. (in: a-proteobacteria)]|uniref:YciI family protein n=1 Tax=Paracoccus sp. TaxID=267 RepID=UPI0035AF7B11